MHTKENYMITKYVEIIMLKKKCKSYKKIQRHQSRKTTTIQRRASKQIQQRPKKKIKNDTMKQIKNKYNKKSSVNVDVLFRNGIYQDI
jgi:hypothetical protein